MSEKTGKARLVVRVFKEVGKDIIARNSPVASSASHRMVLQACGEKQYRLHLRAFKTAFLQVRLMSRENSFYTMPPAGFGISSGKAWKLNRPAYGLSSAPNAWYDRLLERMEESGLDSELSDEGALRTVDAEGEIIGNLALHVDDIIGGGTVEFHAATERVCCSLKFDSREQDKFHYKGLRVTTIWDSGIENRGTF